MRASQVRPLAVLLGAGASVEAGVPAAAAMSEALFEASRDEDAVAALLSKTTRAEGRTARFRRADRFDLVARAHSVARLLEFIGELEPLAKRNMEVLYHQLRLLDQYWSRGVLQPRVQDFEFYATTAADAIRLADSVLNGLLCPRDRTTIARGIRWPSASYLSGVYTLVEKSMRTCAHVYTLNYDIALETALDDANVPWTTGFEIYRLPRRQGDRVRWKRGQVGFFNPSAFDDPSIRIAILKLHGSHRWAVATGEAEGGFSSAFVVELSASLYARIVQNTANVKRPLRLKVTLPLGKDAVSDHFLEFGLGRVGGAASFGPMHRATTPLLILADENKARWSQPYRALHSRFEPSLLASGVLVVIGYGWADEYLNERIGEAFLRSGGLMSIITVSRSEPPINHRFPGALDLDGNWLVAPSIDAFHSPRGMFWLKGSAEAALRGEPCKVFAVERSGWTFRFKRPVVMTLPDVVSQVTRDVDEFLHAAAARVERKGTLTLRRETKDPRHG